MHDELYGSKKGGEKIWYLSICMDQYIYGSCAYVLQTSLGQALPVMQLLWNVGKNGWKCILAHFAYEGGLLWRRYECTLVHFVKDAYIMEEICVRFGPLRL